MESAAYKGGDISCLSYINCKKEFLYGRCKNFGNNAGL